MVCYQEEVRDPSRVAEVLNRVILKARRFSAPAQINIPRDFWTQVIDITLPALVEFERPAGGDQAIAEAANCCRRRSSRSSSPAPAWCSAARSRTACARRAARRAGVQRLPAQRRLPRPHRLAAGPLGLQRLEGGDGADRPGRRRAGARHAAQSVFNAARLRDRLLADRREDHPGRHQPRPHRPDQAGDRRNLRRRRAGARQYPGAAGADGRAMRGREERKALGPPDQVGLGSGAFRHGPRGRRSRHHLERRARDARTGPDVAPPGLAGDPGRPAARRDHLQRHRQQLRDRQRLSDFRCGAEISRARGCSVPAATASRRSRRQDRLSRHPRGRFRRRRRLRNFDERDDARSAARAGRRSPWSIFRNYQWGAEKRNTTFWYDDNFVGTELNPESQLRQGRAGLRPEGVGRRPRRN